MRLTSSLEGAKQNLSSSGEASIFFTIFSKQPIYYRESGSNFHNFLYDKKFDIKKIIWKETESKINREI